MTLVITRTIHTTTIDKTHHLRTSYIISNTKNVKNYGDSNSVKSIKNKTEAAIINNTELDGDEMRVREMKSVEGIHNEIGGPRAVKASETDMPQTDDSLKATLVPTLNIVDEVGFLDTLHENIAEYT